MQSKFALRKNTKIVPEKYANFSVKCVKKISSGFFFVRLTKPLCYESRTTLFTTLFRSIRVRKLLCTTSARTKWCFDNDKRCENNILFLFLGFAAALAIPLRIFLRKAKLCGHYETRASVHAQSSCLSFCWSSAISATFNSSLSSHHTCGIARFDPHCNLCPRARGFNNAAESTSKRNSDWLCHATHWP